MSAPPVKRPKISNEEQKQLMAMYKLLPVEAQKDGYEGLSKSYTFTKDDAPGASKISVLVDKQVYFVYPVEALGEEDQNLKINNQEKHFNIRSRVAQPDPSPNDKMSSHP